MSLDLSNGLDRSQLCRARPSPTGLPQTEVSAYAPIASCAFLLFYEA